MLVTGAASGIGAATARLFAAEGAAVVVVVDVDEAGLATTAAAIESAGAAADVRRADVSEPDAVTALIDGIVAAHGRLDAAHNNAGISGAPTAFTDLGYDEWERMIAVNLTGVFLCMQRELAVMSAQGSGAIVNTSSGAGVVGFPGLPHYVAAKHGVLGLTKTAATEYTRSGVRVNAVLPGVVDTPMVRGGADPSRIERFAAGAGRGTPGQPSEIAEAVVWLCSDRASFVNGESMLVDGGTVCR